MCNRRLLHVWPRPSTKVAEGGRCFQTTSITPPAPMLFFNFTHRLQLSKKRRMLPSKESLSVCSLCNRTRPCCMKLPPLSFCFTLLGTFCFPPFFLVYLSSSLTSHLFAFSFGVYHGLTFTPNRVSICFSSFFNSFPQLIMSLI